MERIVIIGGGASGLACAMQLSEYKQNYGLDLEITLLEANDKLGKKILASGNGRCNLSNQFISSSDYQHHDSFDLNDILSSYDLSSFFEQRGLWVKAEGDLIYPNSKQASTVVNFMASKLHDTKVHLNQLVKHVNMDEKMIYTTEMIFEYDYLVIACGSHAAKSLGGKDSGYTILKENHHHITKLSPALVQMKTKEVKKYLKGTRLRGTFSLIRDNYIIHQEKGELLFTDYGLSGIAIFQLSRFYQDGDEIELDLFDDLSESDLARKIKPLIIDNCFQFDYILPYYFGKFMEEKIGVVNYQSIKQTVHLLKHYRFHIDGLNDFEHAQIVKGGLSLNDVHNDLSSIYYPEVYIIGELLDIDGPCGGYNLHFAFSSGNYAANKIFEKLLGGE